MPTHKGGAIPFYYYHTAKTHELKNRRNIIVFNQGKTNG
jgi:hypothetical protein